MAAIAIQIRFVTKLLDDGLAADPGRPDGPGGLAREAPERIGDVALLVATGCAVLTPSGFVLGCVAALLAVLTSGMRLVGRAVGVFDLPQGPMGTYHRLAVLAMACLTAANEGPIAPVGLRVGLAIIVAGCAVTLVRRATRLVRVLSQW